MSRNFSLSFFLLSKLLMPDRMRQREIKAERKPNCNFFFLCRHIRRKMAQTTYATRFFHSLTAMMTMKTIRSNWNWNWMNSNRRSTWTVSHRAYSEKWTKKEEKIYISQNEKPNRRADNSNKCEQWVRVTRQRWSDSHDKNATPKVNTTQICMYIISNVYAFSVEKLNGKKEK